ncbi:hypothetical protein [Gabonibacter chumensis]|uniref:hypothetical protein n=1 Tax=Gabonibacter chumensis TaxID=2972474 RepID=UPI0025730DFF|nr:hypothetical protein [Gabonibacter chumensis]MCR9011131.1 hypothetical protein [Gabonibacter chumensis]
MKAKKPRGLRRYYRNLAADRPFAKQIDEWTACVHCPDFDYEHIHFDCPKYTLRRWRGIKAHLDALIHNFNRVAESFKTMETQFQLWAFIGLQEDFGIQPILYLHTPNTMHNDFPHKIEGFSTICYLKDRNLASYIDELTKKGYEVLYSSVGDEFPSIIVYKKNVGEDLV